MCSLCDHLMHDHTSIVGRAEWFSSHTWQYSFLDVVDALTTFFHEKNQPDVVVWFDLFSLPQHQRQKIEADWLKATFTQAVDAMRNVVMVLSPWDKPITLTRAWCVFELYACALAKGSFHVAIPPNQQQAFTDLMVQDPDAYLRKITAIKSDECQATEKDDLVAIQQAIRLLDIAGFEHLDRMVFSNLSEWMIGTMQSRLEESERVRDPLVFAQTANGLAQLYETQGRAGESWQMHLRSVDMCKEILGDGHVQTLISMSSLGSLYIQNGGLDDGIIILEGCSKDLQRLCGDDSEISLVALCSLATGYIKRAEYNKGRQLNELCVSMIKAKYGEDHPLILRALNNVGEEAASQMYFDSAAKAYALSFEKHVREFAEDHRKTLETRIALCRVYIGWQIYDLAESPLRECMTRCERVFGRDHPLTFTAISAMAKLMEGKGNVLGASALYKDHVCRAERIFGRGNARTIEALGDLARFKFARFGQDSAAEQLLEEGLSRARRLYDEDHPVVSALLHDLAAVYKEQGKWVDAEPL
ncbi:Kinesin light chain 3 [Rhizophlyctis rosea]|nr:Kinesin light chain 3 [Rhizophlyctis rosea]